MAHGRRRSSGGVRATAVQTVSQLASLILSFVDHSAVALPIRNYPELAALDDSDLQAFTLGFLGNENLSESHPWVGYLVVMLNYPGVNRHIFQCEQPMPSPSRSQQGYLFLSSAKAALAPGTVKEWRNPRSISWGGLHTNTFETPQTPCGSGQRCPDQPPRLQGRCCTEGAAAG